MENLSVVITYNSLNRQSFTFIPVIPFNVIPMSFPSLDFKQNVLLST